MKHKPTTPANRVAALRYQAERLLQDAAAWGYVVTVLSHPVGVERTGEPVLLFTPLDELVRPSPLIKRHALCVIPACPSSASPPKPSKS